MSATMKKTLKQTKLGIIDERTLTLESPYCEATLKLATEANAREVAGCVTIADEDDVAAICLTWDGVEALHYELGRALEARRAKTQGEAPSFRKIVPGAPSIPATLTKGDLLQAD